MPFTLAVDYDGTLFLDSSVEKTEEGEFTYDKGEPNMPVIEKVKEFKEHGAEVILWTCRNGEGLKAAVKNCAKVGLTFDAINDNSESSKEFIAAKVAEGEEPFCENKIFFNFCVDDRCMNIDTFLHIDVAKTCALHAEE